MATQYVHFSVDPSTGILLQNIAQEHLLYGLDLPKALNVFNESFGGGCPEDIQRDLLIGKRLILVEDESFVVVDREDYMHLDKMYPPQLDFESIFNLKQQQIDKDCEGMINTIEVIDNEFMTKEYYSIDFSIDSALQFIYGNNRPMIDELLDDFELNQLITTIRVIKDYIEKSFQYLDFVNAVNATFNLNYDFDSYQITELAAKLQYLIRKEFEYFDLNLGSGDISVDNYIKTEIAAEEMLKEGIKPVDIMDNYSAGWLAPDGKTFYGMNGEIANMLHNKLAEAMYEAGLMPQSEENEANPDGWLGEHGWAKIHDNWIVFDGYSRLHHYNMMKKDMPELYEGEEPPKEYPITREQVATFADYIQEHHQIMRVGVAMTKMTPTMFRMIEPLQFKLKFFNF